MTNEPQKNLLSDKLRRIAGVDLRAHLKEHRTQQPVERPAASS